MRVSFASFFDIPHDRVPHPTTPAQYNTRRDVRQRPAALDRPDRSLGPPLARPPLGTKSPPIRGGHATE
jgi:hypothetical protein